MKEKKTYQLGEKKVTKEEFDNYSKERLEGIHEQIVDLAKDSGNLLIVGSIKSDEKAGFAVFQGPQKRLSKMIAQAFAKQGHLRELFAASVVEFGELIGGEQFIKLLDEHKLQKAKEAFDDLLTPETLEKMRNELLKGKVDEYYEDIINKFFGGIKDE